MPKNPPFPQAWNEAMITTLWHVKSMSFERCSLTGTFFTCPRDDSLQFLTMPVSSKRLRMRSGPTGGETFRIRSRNVPQLFIFWKKWGRKNRGPQPSDPADVSCSIRCRITWITRSSRPASGGSSWVQGYNAEGNGQNSWSDGSEMI